MGCDTGGELVAGNTDPYREVEVFGGDDGGLPHVAFAFRTVEKAFHAADIGEDQVRGGVFDTRGETGCGLDQGFVRRSLTRNIAAAGDE